MRVLIVKTSSLGDVIHMLPALTDARLALPGMEFDWLVEEGFSAVPAWHPGVKTVFCTALRRWKKHPFERTSWQEIRRLHHALRAVRYDLVLDTQGLLKSALWAFQVRAPVSGYAFQSAREPLASLFYRRRYPVLRTLHAIERNRQLTANALDYPCPMGLPDHGLEGLTLRLHKAGCPLPEELNRGPYVLGLHGTSREDKEWPVAHWVALAVALVEKGCPLYLPWGNPRELERAQFIARHALGTHVLPRLSLDQLALLTAQAQAVVGVDTGLMHLAAALGKPGLALYTATQPGLTGVVRDAKAQAAMDNVSAPSALAPETVIAALLARLPC
jgi:heptosyltransferase I